MDSVHLHNINIGTLFDMCTEAIRFKFKVCHIFFFLILQFFKQTMVLTFVCFASESVESAKLSYKISFYKIRPINIYLTTAK